MLDLGDGTALIARLPDNEVVEVDSGPVAGSALDCAVDLDVGPATKLLVTTTVGVNTIVGKVLEVRDGAMQAVRDARTGGIFSWTFGGGVRHGSGYRVGPNSFSQTYYDAEAGSPFGWGVDEFVLTGGAFRPIRSTRGETTDPGPYAGSGCPGGPGTFTPI